MRAKMSIKCLICSEILNTPQDTSISTRNHVIVTKCGHLFHNMCIRQWLLKSRNRLKCPTCKSHLDAIEFAKVNNIEEYIRKQSGTVAENTNKSASDLLQKLDHNITKGEQLLGKADELLIGILDLLIDNNTDDNGGQASGGVSEDPVQELTETIGGLKIGDRVVWMGDGDDIQNDACDFGCVKWLGTVNNDVVAGVVFDDPSGNTNGELNGRQYFSCRPNYGRFLFVRELLLYDDLFE